jgi:DNA-binding GntR family transcriptional regulator
MPQEILNNLFQSWSIIPEDAPQPGGLDFPALDEEFHEALAQATENQTLVQSIRGIDERLHIIRIYDITTRDRLQRTCEQHLEILRCIQARDVTGAQEALRINVMDGRTHAEQAVKEAITRAYLGKS